MQNANIMFHNVTGIAVAQVRNDPKDKLSYYTTEITVRDVDGNLFTINLFSNNLFCPLTVAEHKPE